MIEAILPIFYKKSITPKIYKQIIILHTMRPRMILKSALKLEESQSIVKPLLNCHTLTVQPPLSDHHQTIIQLSSLICYPTIVLEQSLNNYHQFTIQILLLYHNYLITVIRLPLNYYSNVVLLNHCLITVIELPLDHLYHTNASPSYVI